MYTLSMNVITTTVLRNNLAESFKEVNSKKDFLLVANKGKITSAIVNIDLFEDLLALTNKKYLESMAKKYLESRAFRCIFQSRSHKIS